MKLLINIFYIYFLFFLSHTSLSQLTDQNITIWNYPIDTGRKVIIPPLITVQPTEFTTLYTIAFREGESFRMPCAAQGIPDPVYSWKWNEMDFDPSGMDGRIAIQPGVGTLIFANPKPIDEAIYQCWARNVAGVAVSIKINVRLAILDPFPLKSLRTESPTVGQALKVSCIPPRSYPNPKVYWAIESVGTPFRAIDYTDRVSQDAIGNLIFSNVRSEDRQNGATYSCVAYNSVMRTFKKGESFKMEPITGTRNILHAPEIAWTSPTQQFAVRDDNMEIQCLFYGNPTPRVSWKRVIPKNEKLSERTKIKNFGQVLRFENIQYGDSGKYECEGINDEGMVPVRRSFDVQIESRPYWVEKPVSQDVSENSTAVFLCSGEADPKPRIIWSINGIPTTNLSLPQKIKVKDNKITVMNVTVKDSMVIQCNITNKHGYNFTNVYLNVLTEPPIIVKKPSLNQKAAESQTIEITCDVRGSPKPYVSWTKGGEQLTGGKFEIQKNGNLKIIDVSLVDAGAYTCTATNLYGVDEASGFLIVRRKTRIVMPPLGMMVYYKTEAKFTCTATTDPEEIRNLRIQWKKDNQVIDYEKSERMFQNLMDNSLTISDTVYLDTGRFTCSASNGIDTDEMSAGLIVQAPPDPPNQVQVRCFKKDNSAEIWWQPGKENFAPILNFIVQFNTSFQPDLWYDIITNVSQNQRRIVVNMSSWGNYSFRVLARNKIGLSLPSTQSFNICTTQPSVPSTNPQNVIAEGDEPGNLVIFWTPMPKIEHNAPDFKYVITWILLNSTEKIEKTEFIGTIDAWHFIVRERYKPYQTFNVSVRAVNSMGDSRSPTKWVIGYSGEDFPKVSPDDFSLVPETLTPSSANFTWSHVDRSPQSLQGMFRGYRVEFGPSSTFPYDVKFQDLIMKEADIYPRKRIVKRDLNNETDPNIVSFNVQRIPPNTEVMAIVRVLTKYFAGPASNPVTFKTPEGLPGPPKTLSIIVQGATHFVITWTPPKEPNGRLIGYNITYQAIYGMNIGRLQYYTTFVSPESTMAKATGLNPNTTYRIYLAASTKAGKGEDIFVDSYTTVSGYPDPPSFQIIDLNDTMANVSWVPSRSGTPGSVFYVQYRPRIHYDWLRSPDEFMTNYMAITHLDPGTTYQVRVVAKNGDGFEAPAVWQEFRTVGVAPGKFDLKITGWFYGIWISLFLIILCIILLMVLKRYTDKNWEEKENEIEEEMRRLQAEEAAKQMGLYNEAEGNPEENLLDDPKFYPPQDERDTSIYKPPLSNQEIPGYYGYDSHEQTDYAGGFKAHTSKNDDTFV